MSSPHDETQPIPRAARPYGAPLPGMAPGRPGTVPRSAQEPRPGTRARRSPRRRSRGPSRVTAGIGRALCVPARAVASRWDDVWPPIVGIFIGSVLASVACVLVFTAWFRWF